MLIDVTSTLYQKRMAKTIRQEVWHAGVYLQGMRIHNAKTVGGELYVKPLGAPWYKVPALQIDSFVTGNGWHLVASRVANSKHAD